MRYAGIVLQGWSGWWGIRECGSRGWTLGTERRAAHLILSCSLRLCPHLSGRGGSAGRPAGHAALLGPLPAGGGCQVVHTHGHRAGAVLWAPQKCGGCGRARGACGGASEEGQKASLTALINGSARAATGRGMCRFALALRQLRRHHAHGPVLLLPFSCLPAGRGGAGGCGQPRVAPLAAARRHGGGPPDDAAPGVGGGHHQVRGGQGRRIGREGTSQVRQTLPGEREWLKAVMLLLFIKARSDNALPPPSPTTDPPSSLHATPPHSAAGCLAARA